MGHCVGGMVGVVQKHCIWDWNGIESLRSYFDGAIMCGLPVKRAVPFSTDQRQGEGRES